MRVWGRTHLWRSVYDTANFVLPKYAARATGAERDAANQILAVLGEFAGVGRAGLAERRPCQAREARLTSLAPPGTLHTVNGRCPAKAVAAPSVNRFGDWLRGIAALIAAWNLA